MKATPQTQSLFYQNLGKVFYAIAAADRVVHEDEVETIKKIVNTEWLQLDGKKAAYEIEAMRQIKIVFYELVATKTNAKKCLNEFHVYKKANEHLFNDEVKKLIWKTANEIAHSFSNKNKSELLLLANLGFILQSEK